MARGNDIEEAKAEFREKHGQTGNAEEIIQANRARYPQELREASLHSLDVAATLALDMDKIDGQCKGGNVKAAAVRGNAVVAVVEDDDGVISKVVLARDKAGPTKAQVEKVEKEIGPTEQGKPRQADPSPKKK